MLSPRRLLPMLAVAMVVAACGTSTPSAVATPTAPPGAMHVNLLDYSISPDHLAAPAGTVTFYVTNDGKTPHNFNVRMPQGPIASNTRIVAHSKDLNPGQSDTFTATFAAGTYTIFCAFPGHESLGMIGVLVVS